MKGFRLDSNGDVVIENGDISIIEDGGLLRQTVETVIGTNMGEWIFNSGEGINFSDILTKNPDKNIVRENVLNALRQCDENFVLLDFDFKQNEKRNWEITFLAKTKTGEIISGGYEFD